MQISYSPIFERFALHFSLSDTPSIPIRSFLAGYSPAYGWVLDILPPLWFLPPFLITVSLSPRRFSCKLTFRLYFGANTVGSLPFHFVCAKRFVFMDSFFIIKSSCVLCGWQTTFLLPHEEDFSSPVPLPWATRQPRGSIGGTDEKKSSSCDNRKEACQPHKTQEDWWMKKRA